MDFIRLFQNIHDPLSGRRGQNAEVEKLKKVIAEKDEIIESNAARIIELEDMLKRLEDKSQSDDKTKLNEETLDILTMYEEFISSTLAMHGSEKRTKVTLQNHLTRLEIAFHDLIEKYDRAKEIILGYQKNETMLLNYIGEFQRDVEQLKARYLDFKMYATNRVNDANATIQRITRENESQVRDLMDKLESAERKIRFFEENSKSKSYIFQPLVTNLK